MKSSNFKIILLTIAILLVCSTTYGQVSNGSVGQSNCPTCTEPNPNPPPTPPTPPSPPMPTLIPSPPDEGNSKDSNFSEFSTLKGTYLKEGNWLIKNNDLPTDAENVDKSSLLMATNNANNRKRILVQKNPILVKNLSIQSKSKNHSN